jgi:DNA-binding CsgD family transcriptional regulator
VRDLYRDRLHMIDPWSYYDFREGEVYALDEMLDPEDGTHEAFRRAFLEPSGMRFIRQMRVMENSGVNVWLTLTSATERFDDQDDALLAATAPYLRTALRCHVGFHRERFAASLSSEATRRLNFGWLTLDESGCVLGSDECGSQIMANAKLIRRNGQDGRPQLGRQVVEEIRALLADPTRRSRALVLSRDPWLDMLLIASNRQAISSVPVPTVVAYVHADTESAADRCEQLGQLFGLLPSEARLALALSRGMTIAEAAADLGLTVETARSYSKKIYAKTGARGQTDLVRFINRSVLSMA